MKHDPLPMWISQWQSLTAPQKMRVAFAIGIAAIALWGMVLSGFWSDHPLSKSL